MIENPDGTFSNRTYEKERKDANGNVMRDANGNALTDMVEIDALAAKIIAEAKPNQMNGFTLDTIKIAADSGLINDFWNGSAVAKAGELFHSGAIDAIQRNMQNEAYYRNRQANSQGGMQFYNYARSGAGQSIGLNAGSPLPATGQLNLTTLTAELNRIDAEILRVTQSTGPNKLANLRRLSRDKLAIEHQITILPPPTP